MRLLVVFAVIAVCAIGAQAMSLNKHKYNKLVRLLEKSTERRGEDEASKSRPKPKECPGGTNEECDADQGCDNQGVKKVCRPKCGVDNQCPAKEGNNGKAPVCRENGLCYPPEKPSGEKSPKDNSGQRTVERELMELLERELEEKRGSSQSKPDRCTEDIDCDEGFGCDDKGFCRPTCSVDNPCVAKDSNRKAPECRDSLCYPPKKPANDDSGKSGPDSCEASVDCDEGYGCDVDVCRPTCNAEDEKPCERGVCDGEYCRPPPKGEGAGEGKRLLRELLDELNNVL